MLAPSIKFTQGVTVGTPNVALMGVLTTSVTAQANTADGSKRWVFSWIDAPPTSAITRAQAVQDSGSVSALTFSPDVAGCYCLQLDSYDANGARATVYLCFGVLNAHGRLPSFPAMVPFAGFPEITAYQCMNFSGGTRGYAPFVEAYFAAVDAGGGGGSNATQLQGFAISASAPSAGQALIYDSTPNWAPHSPGGSLGGTFLSTTVLAIDGTAGTAAVHCANVTVDFNAGAFTLGYAQRTDTSNGSTFTLAGQDAKAGSNANGGAMVIRSGDHDGSGVRGSLTLKVGTIQGLALALTTVSAGTATIGPSGSEWATFSDQFVRFGNNASDPGSGTVRIGAPATFKSSVIGGIAQPLAWDVSGNLQLGDASHTPTINVFTTGTLTLAPTGNLVIQSATKWFKGGSSHAGYTISDQADPQTTTNASTAAYAWTLQTGTNKLLAKVVATRSDQLASFEIVTKYSVVVTSGPAYNDVFSPAAIDGPDTFSTGSTLTAVWARSSGTANLNITGNNSETWNWHVEIEATVQP